MYDYYLVTFYSSKSSKSHQKVMTFWWLAMTFIDLNFLQRLILEGKVNLHAKANLQIALRRWLGPVEMGLTMRRQEPRPGSKFSNRDLVLAAVLGNGRTGIQDGIGRDWVLSWEQPNLSVFGCPSVFWLGLHNTKREHLPFPIYFHTHPIICNPHLYLTSITDTMPSQYVWYPPS